MRLKMLLRDQKRNLTLRCQLTSRSGPPKANMIDDVQRNLFKLLCAVMNLRPSQGSGNRIEQALLDQYLN